MKTFFTAVQRQQQKVKNFLYVLEWGIVGFFLVSVPTALAAPSTPHFENPLSSIETLPDFINALLDIVIKVALPVIVIFIVIAGFMFITAQGNENKLKTARTTLVAVVIGAAIILGAKVIAAGIAGTIHAL